MNGNNNQALGYEVVFACGKEWKLAHTGPGIQAAFADWCRLKARKALIADKAGLGVAEYREHAGLLNDEILADSFSWGPPTDRAGIGRACLAAFGSPSGELELLRLLLRQYQPDITTEQTLAIYQDATEQVTDAMIRCLHPEGDDPNRKAPEQPGTTNSAAAPSTTTA